jgi:CRP/FNR family transcriptional regulator
MVAICIGQLWFDGLRQAEVEAVRSRGVASKISSRQSVFMQGDTAKQISLIKAVA